MLTSTAVPRLRITGKSGENRRALLHAGDTNRRPRAKWGNIRRRGDTRSCSTASTRSMASLTRCVRWRRTTRWKLRRPSTRHWRGAKTVGHAGRRAGDNQGLGLRPRGSGPRSVRGSTKMTSRKPTVRSSRGLKRAGAVVVGKTNTPEFGHMGVTHNQVFGVTRNPWSLDHSPGGSSGGAGAAVAAGLGPLAVGSDGGGSIRIPSSFSGVFGLKPNLGRVPQYPVNIGLEWMSHAGPMTRTVEDAGLMLDVMAGPDERDMSTLPPPPSSFQDAARMTDISDLRIGWSPTLGFATVDAEVAEITERAAREMGSLGSKFEEIENIFEDPGPAWYTLFAMKFASAHQDDFDRVRNIMEPGYLEFVEDGFKISAIDCANAGHVRRRLTQRMGEVLQRIRHLADPHGGGAASSDRSRQSRDHQWPQNLDLRLDPVHLPLQHDWASRPQASRADLRPMAARLGCRSSVDGSTNTPSYARRRPSSRWLRGRNTVRPRHSARFDRDRRVRLVLPFHRWSGGRLECVDGSAANVEAGGPKRPYWRGHSSFDKPVRRRLKTDRPVGIF